MILSQDCTGIKEMMAQNGTCDLHLEAPYICGGMGWATAIGDFNNDGCDDIALGSPWDNNSSHHNYNFKGMVFVFAGNEDLEEANPPAIDEIPQQYETHYMDAYPNPFTNSTILQFNKTTRLLRQLADTPWQANSHELTQIKIYNIKGQLVREFGMQIAECGFSAVWDGKDGSGNDVKSGVYFYKIDNDDEHVGKVVKLK